MRLYGRGHHGRGDSPGGAGKIEVTFDSKERKGRQRKTIHVTTNDPKMPTTDLEITVNIKVEFSFVTRFLRMGNIPQCMQITKSSFLEIADFANTKIIGVETSSPHIEADVVSNIQMEARNQREVRITISPGLPLGAIRETITVNSNLEKAPNAQIRLLGTITPSVEVTPSSLSFSVAPAAAAEKPVEKKLQLIKHCPDVPLQVLKAYDPDGHLSVAFTPLADGNGYEIIASPIPGKAPDESKFTGSIVIKTNNPGHEEMLIEYTLFD